MNFPDIFEGAISEAARQTVNIFRRESLGRKLSRISGYGYARINKGLGNLRERGLIGFDKKTIYITAMGRVWLQQRVFAHMRTRQQGWDGKWRLVIFDIPESQRNQRQIFRRKLIRYGFYPVQMSILLCPYPCEQNIAFICAKLKISKYVDVCVAESIGRKEAEARKWFGL